MTDTPSQPVGMRKSAPSTAGASTPSVPRPRTAVIAVVLVALSGLFSVIAALTLYSEHAFVRKSVTDSVAAHPLTNDQISSQGSGLKTYLTQQLTAHPSLSSDNVSAQASATQTWVTNHLPKSNVDDSDISDQASKAQSLVSDALGAAPGTSLTSAQLTTQAQKISQNYVSDLKTLQTSQPTPADIQARINQLPMGELIRNLVWLVVVALVGWALWRGKYWGRWLLVALLILSNFIGGLSGLNALLSIAVSLPIAFKLTLFLAGLTLVAAIVAVFLPASSPFFLASRPAGVPAQRRGLFGGPPRPRPAAAADGRATATAGASEDRERAKSRQAASAASVAKGADLARSRAKASKSRRTPTRPSGS